jgi:ATP-dependent protease ClpP protease subunit
MHKRLLQLLRDNARREAPKVRTEVIAGETTVYLYDVIDSYFGISATDVAGQLAGLKGQRVAMRINSPGGDVFEARAIAVAIAQHGDVHAHIDGLAASAATYIATACKTVQIADGAFFMIHNAWTFAYGNKADLRTTADLLDKVDQTIISDFVKKTGRTTEEIAAWMTAETWFTAQEALENGFVDTVFDLKESSKEDDSPQALGNWNLKAYANAPKALTEPPPPPALAWEGQRIANSNRLRLLEAS